MPVSVATSTTSVAPRVSTLTSVTMAAAPRKTNGDQLLPPFVVFSIAPPTSGMPSNGSPVP